MTGLFQGIVNQPATGIGAYPTQQVTYTTNQGSYGMQPTVQVANAGSHMVYPSLQTQPIGTVPPPYDMATQQTPPGYSSASNTPGAPPQPLNAKNWR